MSQLITYLTFGGNCQEAMFFYQQCLGGELNISTLADSPMGERFPAMINNFVLHASLKKGKLILMGTDMVGEEGLVKGNAVSIFIECSSEKEIKLFYKKLSAGGKADYPLESDPRGSLFGNLTDKYGVQWLLHYKTIA